jgi:hypothetical protein
MLTSRSHDVISYLFGKFVSGSTGHESEGIRAPAG